MDERIGIIGGDAPRLTVSGQPLPPHPFPTTVQLHNRFYVVVDTFPTVDVNAVISELERTLYPPPSVLIEMPEDEREQWLAQMPKGVETEQVEDIMDDEEVSADDTDEIG